MSPQWLRYAICLLKGRWRSALAKECRPDSTCTENQLLHNTNSHEGYVQVYPSYLKTGGFYYSKVFARRSQNWLSRALLSVTFSEVHTFYAQDSCLISPTSGRVSPYYIDEVCICETDLEVMPDNGGYLAPSPPLRHNVAAIRQIGQRGWFRRW